MELQDISSKQPKQFEEHEGNEDVQDTDEQNADHMPTKSDYMLVRDRARREIRAPQRHCYADLIVYAFLVVKDLRFDEPSSYKEEISCKDANLWKVAMQEEMESLNKNKTWILVDKPKDGKTHTRRLFANRLIAIIRAKSENSTFEVTAASKDLPNVSLRYMDKQWCGISPDDSINPQNDYIPARKMAGIKRLN